MQTLIFFFVVLGDMLKEEEDTAYEFQVVENVYCVCIIYVGIWENYTRSFNFLVNLYMEKICKQILGVVTKKKKNIGC